MRKRRPDGRRFFCGFFAAPVHLDERKLESKVPYSAHKTGLFRHAWICASAVNNSFAAFPARAGKTQKLAPACLHEPAMGLVL
jgi:hypothetical protein